MRHIDLIVRFLGTFALATLLLFFSTVFVHMLSDILSVGEGGRWAGLGHSINDGGVEMWICGGPPTVLWRNLPLYVLLCFAISWQVGALSWTRLSHWACLFGICVIELGRFSSLRMFWVELKDHPDFVNLFFLDSTYLLCVLTVGFLGAKLAGRDPGSRFSAVIGWAGGLAFAAPVPFLLWETSGSPATLTISQLLAVFLLTSLLFIHGFILKRPIRGLGLLWIASILTLILLP